MKRWNARLMFVVALAAAGVSVGAESAIAGANGQNGTDGATVRLTEAEIVRVVAGDPASMGGRPTAAYTTRASAKSCLSRSAGM